LQNEAGTRHESTVQLMFEERVLDPQASRGHAIGTMGFDGLNGVRRQGDPSWI